MARVPSPGLYHVCGSTTGAHSDAIVDQPAPWMCLNEIKVHRVHDGAGGTAIAGGAPSCAPSCLRALGQACFG